MITFPTCEIRIGDCLELLRAMPDESVHCVITSPPYYGLRDYGVVGQMGLEETFAQFLAKLVNVFREVRRVLRADGTCWINIGDSYASSPSNKRDHLHPDPINRGGGGKRCRTNELPAKSLMGVPWRLAFALQDDGWLLRQDIIWAKPNPMPESVKDRCTRSHEYVFMFTKSANYYYDAEAIREPVSAAMLKQMAEGYDGEAIKGFGGTGAQDASATKSRIIESKRKAVDKQRGHSRRHVGFNQRWDNLTKEEQSACGSNKKSVWTVSPFCLREAHFAAYPPDLIKPCVMAGCPVGGVVLDCFGGSGTTGQVALEHGRSAILLELNPEYAAIADRRTNVTPGLPLTA